MDVSAMWMDGWWQGEDTAYVKGAVSCPKTRGMCNGGRPAAVIVNRVK